MFKKSPLKATRLHKQKTRIKILKLSLIAGAVLLVFGSSVWISRINLFALTTVDVKGNINIDSQDVQAIAQKDLAGAYASLYAKSNKMLYPKARIAQDIKTAFPSIEALSVGSSGHTLDISISERKPAYTWCKGMPNTNASQECYFMDTSGYIFSNAPSISGNAYLVFYGLIQDENPIGKTFLSSDEFKQIDALKQTFDHESIELNAFVVNPDNSREVYLSHGGKIIFNGDQDMRTISSSVDVLKKNTNLLNGKGTTTLDYIDLRFGNKVYYKFIGDNAVQTNQ